MAEKPMLFSGPMVRAILAGRKTQTRRAINGVPMFDAEYDRQWHPHVCPPGGSLPNEWSWWEGPPHGPSQYHKQRLPIAVGDLLWVKETFRIKSWDEDGAFWITYEADRKTSGPLYPDDESYMEKVCDRLEKAKVDTDPATGYYINIPRQLLSRPSIFMPKAFSRITLRITAVKVARLQDISEKDAEAEGIELGGSHGLSGWIDYSHDERQLARRFYRDTRESFKSLWNSINGPGSWDANPWVAAYTFERVTD